MLQDSLRVRSKSIQETPLELNLNKEDTGVFSEKKGHEENNNCSVCLH